MSWDRCRPLYEYLVRRQHFAEGCCAKALQRGHLTIARDFARRATLTQQVKFLLLDR